MRTFDEIEDKEPRLSVQTDKPEGSGALYLDRRSTNLSLTTKILYHPKTDINGWFDLKLRHGKQQILLLNAFFQGQTNHGTQNEIWETQIFPNIIVFNAEALDKNAMVKSVIFRIEKFSDFFVHHVVEHQHLSDASKDVVKSLKKLRKNKFSKQYPVPYDFHKPESVYVVHLPPRILSFEALGNRYQIGWGMRTRGMGWDGIDVRAEPIASIAFKKSKTVDEATDEIWRWKRLFCQLAMERLDLTMISARGASKRTYADLYLSNEKKKKKAKMHDPWAFSRGESPYCRWKERTKLALAMRSWLAKEDARHTFRVSVDRVIANMQKIVDLGDVVTLCSAIESLDELKSPAGVTVTDLKKVATAAVKEAKNSGIAIDSNRISGVIGSLKHPGLQQRLKLLLEKLSPHISDEQAKIIRKGAKDLRTIAAHGGSMASLSIPRVRPIVTALAGSCVLYDLLTSEFPTKAHEPRRIRALQQISQALEWIVHLDRAQPTSPSKA